MLISTIMYLPDRYCYPQGLDRREETGDTTSTQVSTVAEAESSFYICNSIIYQPIRFAMLHVQPISSHSFALNASCASWVVLRPSSSNSILRPVINAS